MSKPRDEVSGEWIIEFRNGSFFQGLEADHGGSARTAVRFPSKEAASKWMHAHEWILFNGGMAVLFPAPKCRRCGKALQANFDTEYERVESVDYAGNARLDHVSKQGKLRGYGYASTGYFCTLRCGHAWAVHALALADAFKKE